MTKRDYQTSAGDQLSFMDALECAPDPVRGHGLRAAHRWPRVGNKRASGHFWSGRVPASHAWAFPYIELADAGSTWAVVSHDCDNREDMAAGLDVLPPYNWLVQTERGAHVTWCLAAPVARHHAARQAPETYLARVGEYYHHALQADPAFSGLGRNPANDGARTIWGREAPYSLDDLANVIPFGWKRPRVALTGMGRNVDAFRAGLRWAGEDRNRGLPVLPALHAINAEVSRGHPDGRLSDNELADIARSIERYRQKWERDGWHKPAWLERQRVRGGRGGVASGQARRAATADRDKEIVAAVMAGASMRAVASAHGLTHPAVLKIVRREAPLFAPVPDAVRCPWEAEGVSRATWYRSRETGGNRSQHR